MYLPIAHALQELEEALNQETTQRVHQLLATVVKGQFVTALNAAAKVFSITFPLCKYLQRVDCDLAAACEHVDIVVNVLHTKVTKSDDEFHKIFTYSEEMLSEIGEEMRIPHVDKQCHRDNMPASTKEVNPHLRGTEIRTSISPSSVIWLNTTGALANYATEAVDWYTQLKIKAALIRHKYTWTKQDLTLWRIIWTLLGSSQQFILAHLDRDVTVRLKQEKCSVESVPVSNVEEREFSWQEKVFSPFEVSYYKSPGNCHSSLDEKYHQDVTELYQTGTSTNRLFTYTDNDDFASTEEVRNKPTKEHVGKVQRL
uniref:Uncharacterized protein n=1 Tax=Timema genevievae TaxID=629358 RepID=A0A7R9PLZ4_TIMGE|nr:unnamed protein product [Timema genevievae]